MVNKRVHKLAKKILFKLSVRVEVSSVESNKTTAATVSCDLAPPPQRRRRRHPPPPHHVTFLSLQYITGLVRQANCGRAADLDGTKPQIILLRTTNDAVSSP